MKKLLASKPAQHAALALGGGLAVFLAETAAISPNDWVKAGCAAGIAFLGGLGIGVAKRSTP